MANSPCSRWYTSFYWLTIMAVCACFSQCSADCNDIQNTPVIDVSEVETVGQPIFNISAVSLKFDPDSHGNEKKDWLEINGTSPGFYEVILKKSFDAESEVDTINFKCDKTSISAGLIAIDFKCLDQSTNNEQRITLYLNILDVDEFAPHFEQPDSTVTIPENQENGTSVYTLKACDPDSQNTQVIYDIVDYLEGTTGYFDIPNRYTGQVVLVKELDYDSGPTSFVLNISATELLPDGDGLVNYTTLTINITDLDDLMPEFTDPRYTLSIPEGNYTGYEWFNTTPVLSARDGDHHINETIRFRMGQDSQNTGLFSVAENGSIAANGSLYHGTYNILVEAYQIDKARLRYVTTIVTITATDINDHKPEMVQPFYNVTVVESAPVGTLILIVDAKDADVGNNSVIEFHLNGTGDNVFTVETRGHTGLITLTSPLDRESQTNYTFEIWAEETLTQERYSSNKSQIVIFVADVNDHDPVFTSQSYTFNLTRTQLRGDFVGQVSAFDADGGPNGEITYTIQFSTLQPSAFTIDNSTGNITLSRDLQYSDVGVHHLSVIAADNPNNSGIRRSTNAQVTINILPANTQTPEFGNQSYTFHILETSTPGHLVGKVTAADGDGDRVEYSSENINSYFSLNATSGEITVNNTPDLDDIQSPDPYVVNFTVNATDGVHNTSTVVTVFVISANEFPPKFVPQEPVPVSENATEETIVAQANATDEDAGSDGSITFSLLPSEGSDLFKIDPITGVIRLNCSDCLDPRRGTYDLIIQAKDGGSPTFTDTMVLPVKIQKTIFAPPKFTQPVYYISVKENQTSQIVLQLLASDDDTPRAELNFSRVHVNPESAGNEFVIFPNGSIYINDTIDAEVFNYVELDVNVSDGHGSDNARVIVNITDVNEYAPVLNITVGETIKILENISIGQVVAAVGAKDMDVSNDSFSYFLSAGADGKFVIDTNTGIITVSGSLDRNLQSEYNITVNVFDHGSPPRLASGNLIVQVRDSNSAPYFTNGSATVSDYHFYVPENLTVGDLVGSLNASDGDMGSSGKFTFRLQPGVSSSYFSLDKDSGNLTLAQSLDYEKITEYSLTAIVSDNSYTPKNATANVTIYVINIEEAPEWPLPLSTVYVTQSSVCKNQQQRLQVLSEEVTTVSSRGEDAVEYSLVNMTQEFSINNTSGLLKINHTLNEGVYNVWLRACNRNSTICSDAVLTVIVQNKKTLAFCPAFYTVDVNETAFVNFSFLDLKATEGDDVVSYNISAGNTDGKFWIGMHDGKLYVADKLDTGKISSYILLVSAEDLSSHEVAEAQVVVRILGVAANEVLRFSAATYHGEILESQVIGSPVLLPLTDVPLAVAAKGRDENSQLIYSLDPSSDTSNGCFNITMNGTIILAKTIDYEAIPANLNKTYTFTVNVTDRTSSGTAMVVVHVQDVNDNDPRFVDPTNLVLNITEGQTSGQDLVQVNATDPDTHTTLVYSIDVINTTGAPRVFYIDRSSGMIIILRDLDHEDKDKYVLNVTVSDGMFNISETVTVNVLDINDNAPIFKQIFNMTVIEGDSGIGTNISVKAFDADSGQNADVNYTVVSGNVNGTFVFDSVNKNILKTIRALDKESVFHHYGADLILTIQAVDNGNTPQTGTGTVFVTITDIDDNPPQFSQKRYTAKVPENAINITVDLTPQLDLTDADIDDCPSYQFSLSDNSSPFVVNTSTGILFVRGKLDRETRENYTLQITAIDNCGKGLNSSAEIFIEILDVDDEPPTFLESVYNFSISKNAQLRHRVGIVKANDVDTSGDLILYKLSESDLFHIDPKQGEIFLIGDLSSGNISVFSLNVSACDAGILDQCGNATVHISVTGICPVWNTTSLNLYTKEGETGFLGQISTLHDNLSNVTYFSNDTVGAQWLEISPSGEVTLSTQLKADKADETNFMISVFAKDYSQPNCSLPGTLSLTVLGTNDHDPEICYQGHCGDSEIEITVFDGSPENSLIALIATRDNDTGPDGNVTLTLTVATSGLEDLFSLKATEIILQKQINLTDLMANSSIQNDTIDLILTATDQGQPPLSTNTTIRVQVVSAQGGALSFTRQTYFLNVEENEKSKTVIGTVAVNSSLSTTTTLKYSIYAPVGNVPFKIEPKTGTITTSAVLDRETTEYYLFTVVAIHPSQPQVSALALVVVNVTDVNESPQFDKPNITLTALENVAPLDLTTLTAHDADEGSNGSVVYILASGSASHFAVNKSTGVLSVIQALDRENISSYDLVIKAVDGGSPALSATIAVHVIVTDQNDHAPNFTQSNYEYNITPSVPPIQITKITATDDDEGLNKDIRYSLQSDLNTFKIDPLSGEIESIAILTKTVYTLIVMAKDQGNPPLNNTVNVIIRLTDNRTSIVPYLSLSTHFLSLIVGLKAGTALNVKITTKDADNLQISGENGTTFFEIVKGQIVLSQDLTQQTVYVLIITATSTMGQNVSQELVIHVDRLTFSQQRYAAVVVENNYGSQIILDVDSNAEKLGIPVFYSLLASYSAFDIENTTGILSVQESLDREKFSVYVLNVSLALDPSATPLNGRRRRAAFLSDVFATVVVQVEDQNDNVPSFDNLGSELHLSIPASVSASYLIKTLKAYDPDEGMNGLIRYKISSGDTSVFDLNPVTGELRVASPEKLGNHSTFTLTVVAADRNGTGSNVTLDVWITIEQDDDQFRLSIPFSVSVLNRNKEDILKSLSRILGLTLSNVQVVVHEESGNVDPDRSYLLFQAHQHSENTTMFMSVSQIQTQVSKHQAEIQKLFTSFESQPQANKNDDNGDMTATSISLIVVACAMFVATLVAIFVSCRMWKKQKKYEEKVEQMRLTADVKPKEDDGNKKYTSVNPGDIELTILSEEPSSTSALSSGTTDTPSNGYLQQVQQSLQGLACESADSGIASPVHSDSDASGEDSPVVVQRNVADEENNDAPGSAEDTEENNDAAGSAEDTVENGDRTTELLREGSSSPLVQKHTYVNVTVENGKDENQMEQHHLESFPASENSSDREEASSFTLLSQDSLPAVSSIPTISSSHDALLQNSVPSSVKHQLPTSYNSIAHHSTEPPVVSSWTPGLSFLNKAFDSSGQADLDSDIEEAITYF